MRNATKRALLRWIHLIVTIPILGYIYEAPSDVQQYAPAVRLVFVPLIILSGYWMYAGALFAIAGVALWLSAYRVAGYGAAVLSQAALFMGRTVWLMIRSRRKKQSDLSMRPA